MEGIPSSWVKKIQIIEMSILSKLIYRFNAMPMKISACFSVEIYKWILKFVWKCRGPKITKNSFERKTKLQVLHCLILRHNKAIVIKTVWHWQKKVRTDK